MSENNKRKTIIWVAGLFCFIAAAVTITAVSGWGLRYPDEHEYVRLARGLVQQGAYVDDEGRPTAYRPPLYPALLAATIRFCDHPACWRIPNMAALLLSAWGLVWLTRHITGAWSSLPVWGMICYPVLFYAATRLFPQTVGAALLIGVVGCLFISSRYWAPATAGVLTGLLILLIPFFILFMPLFVAGIWLFTERRRIFKAVLYTAAALLVVMPWTLRNIRVMDAFVPVSTNSGINLLLGNNPNARPNAGVNVDLSAYAEKAEHLSEVERNAYYRAQALQWMRRRPGDALRLYVLKLVNHFNFRNRLYVQSERSRFRDMVMGVTYYGLLAIVCAGMCYRRFSLRREEWFLIAVYMFSAFGYALFFTRIRFRLPMDCLLIVLAAVAVFNMNVRLDGSKEQNSVDEHNELSR